MKQMPTITAFYLLLVYNTCHHFGYKYLCHLVAAEKRTPSVSTFGVCFHTRINTPLLGMKHTPKVDSQCIHFWGMSFYPKSGQPVCPLLGYVKSGQPVCPLCGPKSGCFWVPNLALLYMNNSSRRSS